MRTPIGAYLILSAVLAMRGGLPPEVLAVSAGHPPRFSPMFWSPAPVECRVFASALRIVGSGRGGSETCRRGGSVCSYGCACVAAEQPAWPGAASKTTGYHLNGTREVLRGECGLW